MTLFTSQSAAMFYDKLFSSLDFTLPRAATGRRGFPKEAMVCAFIVMKCEGFSQITDLMDYLDNNRIIAHYCGFSIMEPLPSYWTYDRCLRQLNNGALKSIMADLVRKLYELGVVDASFVGLDSTPVMATRSRTTRNPLRKASSPRKTTPKVTRTALWASIRPPTSTMSGGMSSTGATKAMCWWTASLDCRSTS